MNKRFLNCLRKYGHFASRIQTTTNVHYSLLKWLDWIFCGWYLPTLSINYVGMSKEMERRLPQLYYIKMKISYDLGFIVLFQEVTLWFVEMLYVVGGDVAKIKKGSVSWVLVRLTTWNGFETVRLFFSFTKKEMWQQWHFVDCFVMLDLIASFFVWERNPLATKSFGTVFAPLVYSY